MRNIRYFPLSLLFAISVVAVVSCGGSQPGNSGTAATSTPTSTPSPTAIPKPKHFGQSAASLLQGLKAKGLPIGSSTTYTAATDLNHLLGRPGQYTDKVSWKDTRIGQDTGIGVSDGGSLEVFANTDDARKRFAYLQSLSTSGNALFAEYEYLDGVVILRVSSHLTPDQATAYKTALQSLA